MPAALVLTNAPRNVRPRELRAQIRGAGIQGASVHQMSTTRQYILLFPDAEAARAAKPEVERLRRLLPGGGEGEPYRTSLVEDFSLAPRDRTGEADEAEAEPDVAGGEPAAVPRGQEPQCAVLVAPFFATRAHLRPARAEDPEAAGDGGRLDFSLYPTEELFAKAKSVRNPIKKELTRRLKGAALDGTQRLTPRWLASRETRAPGFMLPRVRDSALRYQYRTKVEFSVGREEGCLGNVGPCFVSAGHKVVFPAARAADPNIYPRAFVQAARFLEGELRKLPPTTRLYGLFEVMLRAAGELTEVEVGSAASMLPSAPGGVIPGSKRFSVSEVLACLRIQCERPQQEAQGGRALAYARELFAGLQEHVRGMERPFTLRGLVELVPERGRKDPVRVPLTEQVELRQVLCGLPFRVSPTSFFQSNLAVAEDLFREVASRVVALARERLEGPPAPTEPLRLRILDLCCGVGVLGICVASLVRGILGYGLAGKVGISVLGIDSCASAIKDARRNAAELVEAGGLQGVEFEYVCSRLEDHPEFSGAAGARGEAGAAAGGAGESAQARPAEAPAGHPAEPPATDGPNPALPPGTLAAPGLDFAAESSVDFSPSPALTVALLDPPRGGLAPSVPAALRASGLRHVLYVSCNPQSLARDLGLLCACSGLPTQRRRPTNPFFLESLEAFNMFPGCAHVESLAQLGRCRTFNGEIGEPGKAPEAGKV